MTDLSYPLGRSKYRIAVGTFFFLQGLCFSSWGSRIPTIQETLNLSEAKLGSLLFILPAGQIVSMSFIGWLVSFFGSKKVLILSILLQCVALGSLGMVASITQLLGALFLFGLAMNGVNISVNAQAIEVESLYKRSIMATFHGFWSLAGFVGAGIGASMIIFNVKPYFHFILVIFLVLVGVIWKSKTLLPELPKMDAKRPFFTLPNQSLLNLGIIAFCSMLCEGTMFDWSGVYFKKILHAENGWVGAGYTAFMSTMSSSRFFIDRLARFFGFDKILKISGCLIFLGLMMAVLFPNLVSGIAGFLLVGAGVSGIVPLVYSAAGKSKTLSPSQALAAVSTVGFLGFLIGPPLIGLIAGVTNLRISFSVVAFMGLCISLIKVK